MGYRQSSVIRESSCGFLGLLTIYTSRNLGGENLVGVPAMDSESPRNSNCTPLRSREARQLNGTNLPGGDD